MSALSDFVSFVTTADNWSGRNGITHRTWEHVRVSATALGAAVAVALPPALWLAHRRIGRVLATAIVNIGQAMPAYALVAIALPFSLRWGLGLGFWPTFAGLVALALPPIFTNAYAGIVAVDPAAVEAARGMGMREGQVLRRVELPVALPLVLTGVRLSAVQVVATATLGTYVGFGCLGSFISEGFQLRSNGPLLTGAVLVALLALATEVTFSLVQRPLTPWATRARNRKGNR